MSKIYTNSISKIFLSTGRNWYIKLHRLDTGVLPEGTPDGEFSAHTLFNYLQIFRFVFFYAWLTNNL